MLYIYIYMASGHLALTLICGLLHAALAENIIVPHTPHTDFSHYCQPREDTAASEPNLLTQVLIPRIIPHAQPLTCKFAQKNGKVSSCTLHVAMVTL